mmetsp:Transcript_28061/g.39187  ORF Transcript_28061/g.39187 Transcript_28061/m.39187 type:complete len:244 (-) Transcript_28061:146-877(-)
MYTLLSGLYTYLTEKVQYQVLLLGLDYAGKTTFKEQCECIYTGGGEGKGMHSRIERKTSPTVGLNIGKIETGRVKLLLWDLGGQEGLRQIWHNYFAEAHAVIFIVDSTDVERLREAREILDSLLEDPKLKGAPFLILANKQDAPGALGESAIAKELSIDKDSVRNPQKLKTTTLLDGEKKKDMDPPADKRDTKIDIDHVQAPSVRRMQAVSALKGTNVKQAVDWILSVIPTCSRTSRIKLESV